MARDPISPVVKQPFPIIEENEIVNGFGRGSAELGIPTANIPITKSLNSLEPGIYFGFSRVSRAQKEPETKIRNDGRTVEFNNGANLKQEETLAHPMVMSIGFNPFYNNEQKTAEVHIMHKFDDNFYGANIKYCVLGYIRPELDYTTKEALIEDINLDIKMALEALGTEEYAKYNSL